MSKSVGKRYPHKKGKERMGTSGSRRVRSPEAPIGEKPKAVRVWLLGGVRVDVGHRMHREQIMDLLWPDSGKKAESNNLRKTLHSARAILDADAGFRYLAYANFAPTAF
jgi:hypothetical protein